MRTRRHTFLIIVLQLATTVVWVRASRDPSPVRISIVSYNIRHFQGMNRSRKPNWSTWADREWIPEPDKAGFYDFFTRVFASLDADIIALQEIPATSSNRTGILPELARRLDMHAYQQEKSGFHGFGCLSRYPITRGVNYLKRSPGNGMIRVDVAIREDLTLHVYNTHLRYGKADERLKQSRAYMRFIQQDDLHPHVYLGDFNAESLDDPELKLIVDAGYRGQRNWVDHIWIRKDGGMRMHEFTAVKSSLTDKRMNRDVVGSDHLPIRCILEIFPDRRQAGKSGPEK